MRNNYYNLIKTLDFPDIFLSIEELSYTQKVNLLQVLISNYETDIVRAGLYTYQKEYIESDRVDIRRLKSLLMYCCRICMGDKLNAS